MPTYKMTGYGRETDRKRTRVYEAVDKEEAYDLAFEFGLIVDVELTEVIADIPPTDNQLKLIEELRLNPLKKLTKTGISKFIDKALEDDRIKERYHSLPATKKQLDYAKKLGIKKLEGVTRGEISDLIDKAMEKR